MNDVDGSTRARRPLRVGVIGLGLAGAVMVPALHRHPRARLVAAADRSAVLRERFERDTGLPSHDDAAALLARPDVDAVYIATPHQFHREHVELAARHGRHVVVEKPMALSIQDCDAMIEACQRAGVTLVVGHTHAFDPPVQEIRRIAASGTLGALAMLSMWNFTDFLYRPRRPEELDTTQGGGILFNQVPHHVDIARFIAGSEVATVRAYAAVLDPTRPTEGCSTTMLGFRSGAVASMVYSGYDHFDTDELHGWIGATGRSKAPRHGQSRRALAALAAQPDQAAEARARTERYGYGSGAAHAAGQPTHQPHFGLIVATFQRGDVRVTPEGITVYGDTGPDMRKLPAGSDGRAQVLDELCAAVLDGIAPAHGGTFGRGTVQTCLAIRDSARLGREVVLGA